MMQNSKGRRRHLQTVLLVSCVFVGTLCYQMANHYDFLVTVDPLSKPQPEMKKIEIFTTSSPRDSSSNSTAAVEIQFSKRTIHDLQNMISTLKERCLNMTKVTRVSDDKTPRSGHKINLTSRKTIKTGNHNKKKNRTVGTYRAKFDIPLGPDTQYAPQSDIDLRLNSTNISATFVLLVTYARSGSTWLGSITSQGKDTVYVFEPFQGLIVQGYYNNNTICFNNNTCRSPRKLTEKHEFALASIYRIFTCQLSKLHRTVLRLYIRNLRTQLLKSSVEKCLKTSKSYLKCIKQLEQSCLSTSHRVIKTIRLSMTLVQQMVALWPNLRVVHLVRDPRGITNSRLSNAKVFYMARQLLPHSKDMCKRMDEDLAADSVISATYHKTLKVMLYEAIAERPIDGTKCIYDFLNMEITETVTQWVNKSAHSEKKSGYFGTTRTNSTLSAYHWRQDLNFSTVSIVDTVCGKVYKKLGFVPFKTADKLRSLEIPSRFPVPNIGMNIFS